MYTMVYTNCIIWLGTEVVIATFELTCRNYIHSAFQDTLAGLLIPKKTSLSLTRCDFIKLKYIIFISDD